MEDKDLNLKEILAFLGCEKTKFYKDIKLICEAYDIDRGKFKKAGRTKEDYVKDENSFLFRKEWKDIAHVLFTMFDQNPYYNRNVAGGSVTLDEIIRYYNKYIEKINQLPEVDKKLIQSNKIYTATVTEKENLKLLRNRLDLLILFTSQHSPDIRNNIWANLNKQIDNLYISLIYDSINSVSKNNNFFDVKRLMEYYCTSIDKYLAFYLNNKMDLISTEVFKNLIDGENSRHKINESHIEGLKSEIEELKETLQDSMEKQVEKYMKKAIQELTGKSYEDIVNEETKVRVKNEEILSLFQDSGVLMYKIFEKEGRDIMQKQFALDYFENFIKINKGATNSVEKECSIPEIVYASNLDKTLKKFISENSMKPENEFLLRVTVNYIKDWIETIVIDDTAKSVFDESNYYINNPIY